MARIHTHLPDTIEIKGRTYKQHTAASSFIEPNEFQKEKERLKKQGYLVRTIRVLSRNHRTRNNLHGQPYKPTVWLFIHPPIRFPKPYRSFPHQQTSEPLTTHHSLLTTHHSPLT